MAALSELRRLGELPRIDGSLLRERFEDQPPVTRFAPSVTGSLHLGHVVNACWTWALARALGGRVLLRLEDHDRGRFRPEHEAAILDELDWLGLIADEPSTDEFRAGASAFRQSDHPERYQAAVERLRRDACVYACDCSRRTILERTGSASDRELCYDGHCRERGLIETATSRLRVELPDQDVAFEDLITGAQVQRPAEQCGDLLLRDGEGSWTYQSCVAIDDLEEGVDLIVRGRDLLSSSGRQLLLAQELGRRERPVFAHHPLIGDAEGRKLSKSGGDACVSAWRDAGRAPEDLLGLAARLGGLREVDAALEAAQLGGVAADLIARR